MTLFGQNLVRILLLTVASISSLAQTPHSDFSIPAAACLNQNVIVNNTSSNADTYIWDFCFQDLNTLPQAGEAKTVSGAVTPTGISIIQEQGNWYGFLSSRDNNKIFRLDFGNSLEATPNVVDLGNIGGMLSGPQNLEFVKEGNSIYGLLTNFSSSLNSMVRLSFPGGISSAPTAQSLGNIGGWGNLRGLDVIKNGSSYTAIVCDFSGSKVSLIDFGASITNDPTASDVTHISTSIGNPIGTRLINDGVEWYAIVASYGSGKIKRLSFGATLSAAPSITDIYAVTGPTEISLEKEGDEYHIYSASEAGHLHHMRLGATPAGFVSGSQLGNFGILSNTFGFDLVRSAPIWYGFTVDYSNNKLYRIKFHGDCSAEMSINTSVLADPGYIKYKIPKNYFVELTASGTGESDVLLVPVNVQNVEAPQVVINSDNICVNSNVTLNAIENTGLALTSLDWNFGDGQTSTQPIPVHQYNIIGSYMITLDVTGSNSCINRTTKIIEIYAPPVASFTLPSGLICTNNEITFVNSTLDGFDGNLSYQWYSDNQPVATSRDLKLTFTNTGTKNIKLITSIPGCSNEITQPTSTVQSGPLVNFSFTGKCEGDAIQFTSDISEIVLGYDWDFEDGTTSTEDDPAHTFINSGDYLVKLTAQSPSGCINSKAKTIAIHGKPSADFQIDPPPFSCNGSATLFTNLTPDPDAGVIESWQWNFDDPSSLNTSSLKNPTHTFANAGDYNVSLTAATEFGCSSSLQKSISIALSPSITINNTATCQGVPVNFSVTGSTIKTYYWEIGTAYYETANPTHTFNASGSQNVKLTVTANNNCASVYNKPVIVPAVIAPDFSVIKNCAGVEATFTDITAGNDPVMQRTWDFAGLGTASTVSPTFTFNTTGNKSVKLSVVTAAGCQYAKSKLVNVVAQPVADFEATPEAGASPLLVQFTNTSTNAGAYTWTFKDEITSTSNQISPSYAFNSVGEYEVDLVARNTAGCESAQNKKITVVNPLPDVELKLITLEENADGTLKMIITLQNKGNTILRDLPVVIDISGNVSITETITTPIAPSSMYNLVLQYGINPSENLKFLCATATLENDLAPEGNRICKEFESAVSLFNVFPNPAVGELNIEWIAPAEQNINISLTDSFGKKVAEADILSANGLNKANIDIRKLGSGLYILRIKGGNVLKTQRIFISSQN